MGLSGQIFKLGDKILRCSQSRGGTPHIPIEGIWSDIQARVGTLHKIPRRLRSRRGETPHIPIEGIWSDGQTRGGDTAHGNAFRCLFLGWDTAHDNCEDVHTKVGTLQMKMY